jgi:hypothetical protein
MLHDQLIRVIISKLHREFGKEGLIEGDVDLKGINKDYGSPTHCTNTKRRRVSISCVSDSFNVTKQFYRAV